MARTINEIYGMIGEAFVSQAAVRTLYGLEEGKPFAGQFSPVSLEAILFYTVAVAVWTLETVFDLFRTEVESLVSARKPHRLKWYRDKTLAFQKDYLLPEDSDVYETIDEAARVVKHAVAVEPPDSSKVLVKIAGGDSLRDKLPEEAARQVAAYLSHIKDAGVRIDLVNLPPDAFRCEVDIYYNAMLLSDRVRDAVRAAITAYIENLPFNGEYSNMALTDILQQVEGVIIPELKAAYSKPAAGDFDFEPVNAKRIPVAGYFRANEETDIIINMIAYELVQD